MKIFSASPRRNRVCASSPLRRNAPSSLFRGWRLIQTQSSVMGMKADDAERKYHQTLRQQMDVWSIFLMK